jgi:hypothetical protein
MAFAPWRNLVNFENVFFVPSDTDNFYADDWDMVTGTLRDAFFDANPLSLSINNTPRILTGGTGIFTALLPDTDVLYDVGTGALRWRDMYAVRFNGSGQFLTGVVLRDGSASMLADLNFGGFKGSNAADPTVAQDLVTLAYLDAQLATGINPDFIDFIPQATPPSFLEGRMWFDDVEQAVSVYVQDPDVIMQLGQEHWIRVTNTAFTTITNGSVVRINGSSGGLPNIVTAIANSPIDDNAVGIATHDIEAVSNGFVTQLGIVHDVNTVGFSDGDQLWLSDSVSGGYTNVPPLPPSSRVPIGHVIVGGSATAGSILVAVGDVKDYHYGEIYISTPAATVIAVAGTYVAAAGTTTSVDLARFDMPVNGRLRYLSPGTAIPRKFRVGAHATINTTLSTATHVRIAKNGVTIASSEMHVDHGPTVETAITTSTIVTLTHNDYVELWVTMDNVGSVTLEHGILTPTEI